MVGADEIKDRCRSAGGGRRRAGKEVVGDDGVHHRQLHVRVRIDAARHDEAAARVDDFGAAVRVEIVADGSDAPFSA